MTKNITISILFISNIILATVLITYNKMHDLSRDKDLSELRDALHQQMRENRRILEKQRIPGGSNASATNSPTGNSAAASSSLNKLIMLFHKPETAQLGLEYVKAQQLRQYRALFDRLHLSEEKLDALRVILANHFIAALDLQQASQASGLPIDRHLLDQSSNDMKLQTEALLGHDGESLVQDAVLHPAAWSQMSDFEDRLQTDKISTLDDTQFAATLDAISTNLQRIPPFTVDPAEFEAAMASKAQRNAASAANLATILSAPQLQAFNQKLSDAIVETRMNYLLNHNFDVGH